MIELTNLDLLTYVIQFDSGRYYTIKPTTDTDWGRPYSTIKIVEAKIFNNIIDAQKNCNNFSIGTKVVPVSKKIFFKAALEGKR